MLFFKPNETSNFLFFSCCLARICLKYSHSLQFQNNLIGDTRCNTDLIVLSYKNKTIKQSRPETDSSIPSRLGHLIQDLKPPQLPILIRHRIVQSMRPNISPKAIKSILLRRRPRTQHFKNPRRHLQTRIRRHHLRTRNPLRDFPSLSGRQRFALFAESRIDGSDLGTGEVVEGFVGADVSCEIAVAL